METNGPKVGEKVLSLTFDGGPTPPHTDNILGVLKRYGARATFFLRGDQVAARPEAARRICAAGHEIGNHSYSHPTLPATNFQEVEREILRAEKVILATTGIKVRLFRPPWGQTDPKIDALIARLGYSKVLWTYSSRDWTLPGSETIARNIVDGAADQAIVVMHDHIAQLPEALELALPQLREYRFVTISEMLERGAKLPSQLNRESTP
ncbi:MAG: polysaccharide deacetylase family protein [Chloroflexi bacterium]|nr:polysaccharide deacetylase family protein [Chloroflexota bacterium]MCL5074323.1 polysaccharide deacetylase family protein [Chloroflexota bacterium]